MTPAEKRLVVDLLLALTRTKETEFTRAVATEKVESFLLAVTPVEIPTVPEEMPNE